MIRMRVLLLITVLTAGSGCIVPRADPASGALGSAMERALASGTATFDHSVWGGLLHEGTEGGLVDYKIMQSHRQELNAYVESIAQVQLDRLERNELKALLINAYNAFTVVAILNNSGVASIRDIDGVWTSLTWDIGGFPVTLDNIEHNLLRPFFKDPRIHFVVNCASHSCAPLPRWAYTGDQLEDQLEERSQAFLSDSRNVELDRGMLRISRYFDWYGNDFTLPNWEPRAESILEFISRYTSVEIQTAIKANPEISLVYIDYDWSLNQLKKSSVDASSGTCAELIGTYSSLPPSSDIAESSQALTRVNKNWVEQLRKWVSGFGVFGPLVYGAIYILAIILVLPASPLTIGAGVAFGIGLGTLTAVLSATIGASFAFLIARYVMRSRVKKWLAPHEKLSAVDRAVESQGWRVVVLTRLSPVLPFNLQNYFYGLTGVSFWHYTLASLFAMLPGTLLYVYIGVAGAELAEVASGAANWGKTGLLVVGLIATLVAAILIARVATQELGKSLNNDNGDEVKETPTGASNNLGETEHI